MMHQQFVQIARPGALLSVATGLVGGGVMGQAERSNNEATAVFWLAVDANDHVTVSDIGPGKPGLKITQSRVGSYLFRAFGDGGERYETRFEPKSHHPDYPDSPSCTIAIPDGKKWIGYSILRGEKVIYTKRFRVHPSTLPKLKPMSLKRQEKPGQSQVAIGRAPFTIDWGGATPDSAYIRYSLDQGVHWGSISNFFADQPIFKMPEQILKINPHPIVEIHAQYGFVERVEKFVWDFPDK